MCKKQLLACGNKKELNFQKPLSLIHVTRHELSPFQAKAMNFLVYLHVTNKYNYNSEHSPSQEMLPLFSEDQKKGKYQIPLAYMKKELGINTRNKSHLVKQIEGLACTGMRFKIVEINDEKNTHKYKVSGSMSYLDVIEVKGEYVTYTLGEAYQAHIDELVSNSNTRYAYLNLGLVSQLKSKFSIGLYELLHGYSNGRFPKIRLTLLSDLLGFPRDYLTDMHKLKEKVLSPAIKELNDTKEMFVNYEIFDETGTKLIKFNKSICIEAQVANDDKNFFLWLADKKNPDAKNKEAYANKLRKEYGQGNIENIEKLKQEFEEDMNPDIFTLDYILLKEIGLPLKESYIMMKTGYFEKYSKDLISEELEQKVIEKYKQTKQIKGFFTENEAKNTNRKLKDDLKALLSSKLSGSEMNYEHYELIYSLNKKERREPFLVTKGSMKTLNLKAFMEAQYLQKNASINSLVIKNKELGVEFLVLDLDIERQILNYELVG